MIIRILRNANMIGARIMIITTLTVGNEHEMYMQIYIKIYCIITEMYMKLMLIFSYLLILLLSHNTKHSAHDPSQSGQFG